MEKYSIIFDGDFRYFVVVEWENPLKKTTGKIVFRAHTETEARDWVLITMQEETQEIHKEFG